MGGGSVIKLKESKTSRRSGGGPEPLLQLQQLMLSTHLRPPEQTEHSLALTLRCIAAKKQHKNNQRKKKWERRKRLERENEMKGDEKRQVMDPRGGDTEVCLYSQHTAHIRPCLCVCVSTYRSNSLNGAQIQWGNMTNGTGRTLTRSKWRWRRPFSAGSLCPFCTPPPVPRRSRPYRLLRRREPSPGRGRSDWRKSRYPTSACSEDSSKSKRQRERQLTLFGVIVLL